MPPNTNFRRSKANKLKSATRADLADVRKNAATLANASDNRRAGGGGGGDAFDDLAAPTRAVFALLASVLRFLGGLVASIVRIFAPYIFLTFLAGSLLWYLRYQVSQGFSSFLPGCDGPLADRLPLVRIVCGNPEAVASAQVWYCHHGGRHITSSVCKRLEDEQNQVRFDAVGAITKSTYDTVDKGTQLVMRTRDLPNPRDLALRSSNLNSLQWAVLYHTNLTDKHRVAEGLVASSKALDGTVDALIELKGDSEFALRDMVDQFERIERALDATLSDRKTVEDLEVVFDDALREVDELLGRLQLSTVDASTLAKGTKGAVDHVQRLLSVAKRHADLDKREVGGLASLFNMESRTQKRQLEQDLGIWEDCTGQMAGLSEDLTLLGVELGGLRHNVGLVRSSWKRSAYIKGDIHDQIASLGSKVAELKDLMRNAGGKIPIDTIS
ncbi:hypothetical protein HKX48_006222 [Thoreauomyces humboldtii]|nr:hypothetical protein HKX48_006222 [Thoreauomyces humboldtii]